MNFSNAKGWKTDHTQWCSTDRFPFFFYDQNVEMELETIERKNKPESEKEEQATKHGRWERKGNHRMWAWEEGERG